MYISNLIQKKDAKNRVLEKLKIEVKNAKDLKEQTK
jgi:hypothetical protein